MTQHVFRYQNFTILKDQILGHGSYGAVYKARCDQLTCAAKVLHPTIVDPYDPGSRKILQRFLQECDFLNCICHPHIVQYLGVCRDPESNLPVLLMELLDSSLTKMLERSAHQISYHIQVDLCSDVSLAVAYLHSNGIIHRDLSGNNVLVIAGRRAKVTDFGMSKLVRSEHHFTPLTFCPGTLGYMSPESLKEPPRYTEKLDVFSQGVIMIQVCTRQFPDPGPAVKEMEDPQSPTGTKQVAVLEPERRKKHIDLIEPTQPLLPIAMECLEYRERDRPSAGELCQRLAALKQNQVYIESSQNTTPATPEMNRTLQQERDELARQVEEKTREITTKVEQIAGYQREIAEKGHQITTQQQEIKIKTCDLLAKTEQIAAQDQENGRLRMQLQRLVDNEQVTAQLQEMNQQLQRQISELQIRNEKHPQQPPKVVSKPQMRSTEADSETEFKWSNGGKAPFIDFGQGSVVDGNVAYFSSDEQMYSFDSSTGKWNCRLLPCLPQMLGSLAIVQGLLTMVGGWLTSDPDSDDKATNKLVSLNKREKGGKWIEQFPPMPTSRQGTTATTYQNHLIVAGGSPTLENSDSLDTVEVLNNETQVWSTAASLPHSFVYGSATICGDRLYILGGNEKDDFSRSVFTCSLPELLQSCHRPTIISRLLKTRQPGMWQYITDTPMYESTCATVHGQLVVVGGRDDSFMKTPAIYKYNPNIQSWSVVSHMTTARSSCYVAVMKTNKLLVVCGYGTDSVEIACF